MKIENKNLNPHIRKCIIYSLAGIVAIISSALLVISLNENKNNFAEITTENVRIPGSIEIKELPENFPSNKPFSVFLDTQLTSTHARISKNPFLKTFQYQFNIPISIRYLKKDQTEEIKNINLKSTDPVLLAGIETMTVYGQEFSRIPLFSVKDLSIYESITITFEDDPESETSFFESVLLLREAHASLFLSLYLPFLLMFSGLIFLQIGIYYLLIAFFHRNLEEGQKSYALAVLLSATMGLLGLDRIYLGYYFSGLLKGLTLGGFGIWYFIDFFLIAAGKLSDRKNMHLY